MHKVVLSTLAEDHMSDKTRNEYRHRNSDLQTMTERTRSPNYKPISTVRFDVQENGITEVKLD